MDIVKAHEILKGLDAPQKKRLTSYKERLSKDRDTVLFDDQMLEDVKRFAWSEDHIEEVRDYLNSIGFTRSKYEATQIQEQLKRFEGKDHRWYGWLKPYKKAKSDLIREVKNWKLECLRYRGNDDIEDALPRHDTHAGFEFIVTGLRTKGEYLDNVYQHYQAIENQAKIEGSFNTPILIGSRTQASGEFKHDGEPTGTFKSKTRLVSMVSIYPILAECMFAKPFQSRLALTKWYAGGKNDDDISIWINKSRNFKYKYSTTIDYSHYDQDISSWLIDDAFDIMRAAFKETCFNSEVFELVRKDFICKCFIDGQGNVVNAVKGVPSGSMFTQIIDSIVNRLMVTTYLNHLNIPERDYAMMIMGDDNIIFSVLPIKESDIASYISRVFGITVNADKMSSVTTKQDPEFLSRDWTMFGGWRHPDILISKLLYPERFRKYQSRSDSLAILASYVRAFPKGMAELIDTEALFDEIRSEGINVDTASRYMSGLEYYRLMYSK